MEKLLFTYTVLKDNDIIIAYDTFEELQEHLKKEYNWFEVKKRDDNVVSIKTTEFSPIEFVRVKKVTIL